MNVFDRIARWIDSVPPRPPGLNHPANLSHPVPGAGYMGTYDEVCVKYTDALASFLEVSEKYENALLLVEHYKTLAKHWEEMYATKR
jgi:hypothetical protein